MARAHPDQFNLFDLPALLFATSEPAGPVRPEPVPDRLSLALLVNGRSAGALMGAAEALAERHGLPMPDFADPFHLPLLDFGRSDGLTERDLGAIGAALDRLSLPRLAVVARQVIGMVLEDGGAAAALPVDFGEALEALLEHLGDGLREKRLGHLAAPPDSSDICIGRVAAPLPEGRLDEALELPLRELALLRGNGHRHDVVKSWTLRA